ncbi:MAG: cbb3-type cytochrome c oxidase subunit 3 [Gallionella sp.]
MSEMLKGYFQTDWELMTRADWAGLVIVLLLSAVMIALYIWIFKPGNRDKFEQYRDFVNKDDEKSGEAGHGQAQ